MTGDDEEARKRRAEALRRRSRELLEGKHPEQPPHSPHEFIEREMLERERRKRQQQEREEGNDSTNGEREEADDEPPV